MKQSLLVFLALLSAFFISWSVKAKMPINRPENLKTDQKAWYDQNYSNPIADSQYSLSKYNGLVVPADYVPVPGMADVYMIVDKNGKIQRYVQAVPQADGSYKFVTINPDIPEGYEPVEGLTDVYKVTDENGNVSYVKYIRNEDDTYCFVPVDKNGNPLDLQNDAEKIDNHYVLQKGNTYALYNDSGVLIGYRERVKEDDGSMKWKETDKPEKSTVSSNRYSSDFNTPDVTKPKVDTDTGNTDNPDLNGQYPFSGTNAVIVDLDEGTQVDNGNGTFTKTSTETNTVTENGEKITYQTKVTSIYDDQGNLLSTKTDGPVEIAREKVTGAGASADPTLIKSDISDELARVGKEVTYDKDKAKEVLTELNAIRSSNGLGTLKMSNNSDLYKLAAIRAADMAIYDNAETSSTLYGSIADMASRWGVTDTGIQENVWKLSSQSASDINARAQADEEMRGIRMSEDITEAAIVIVEQDGQDYFVELYR